MTVSKAQLTPAHRGKGGTLVRYADHRERLGTTVFVVKDLYERKGYTDPERIGVGPVGLGVAFGVRLDEIELTGEVAR